MARPIDIESRIAALSPTKLALLEKKLKKKGIGLPSVRKLPVDTEELDTGSLFERSLIRAHKLMEYDAQLRASKPSSTIVNELERKCHKSIEFLVSACRLYADRPAIGYRAFQSVHDTSLNSRTIKYRPEFHTVTFAALWDRIMSLASGLINSRKIKAQNRIGICGFASPDYLVADFACLYLSITSFPLQTNMSQRNLQQIINEAELCCLFCSPDMLSRIAELIPQCPTILDLVVMDFNEDDDRQARQVEEQCGLLKKRASNISVRTIGALELIGRQCGPTPMVIPAAHPDPLMTVMYTSGSTGSPKGAIYTESIWGQYWLLSLLSYFAEIPMIAVNFMPLNHLMSRMAIIRRLLHGGITYFTLKSDMSTLFEDFRLIRPTTLSLVPRVSQMIYQHYQLELMRHPTALADKTLQGKLEEQVMAEMRTTYLGDRLLLMTSGSAPLAPGILEFLKRCFRVPVIDGYGSTEAGFIARNNRIHSRNVIDYKLVDVPELSYHTSDKPYPRGELRLRCRLSIPGYLKNPDASQDLYDDQGYLKTGDIVEERSPGHLVWLDRTSNILKLSHGEFVSLWRLETIYVGSSTFIHQMYLHGSSQRTYLLAVIVLNNEAVKHQLGPQHREQGAIRHLIRKELNGIARQLQLHSYEIPREFIIESEPFDQENGLLTESGKPSRPNLYTKYGKQLENLYVLLENRQLRDNTRLQQLTAATSTEERIQKALETTLGITHINLNDRFTDLGGDSLDSVHFSSLIERICGVSLPVAFILNPVTVVQDIVDYVEGMLHGISDNPNPTFAQVHGDGATTISIKDLMLKNFLDPGELRAADKLSGTYSAGQINAVLLTGANGFLGRSLMLELIERLPENGGKLYCIVRAKNDKAALQRVYDGFAGADIHQQHHLFKLLSDNRLSVLAGDLTKPKFGLDSQAYEHLSHQVDCIIHNGALVNHAFSYAQLFESNVLGTVEVIRFALATRLKCINFISSAGVAKGPGHDRIAREEDDVRNLWQERPTDGGYAVGYITSKWAGEVLLRELHEQTQVPVTVFRCGMILGDRRLCGQINAGDFFTRLLCGLVNTQLAPQSFYKTPEVGALAHFGGLPVDYVGQSIISIATKLQTRYATYHVVNPHWDSPVSLDLIVDWVESACYRINRIADYARWYQLFSDRLNSLDGIRRQYSPLPIIHQWQNPLHVDYAKKIEASRFVAHLQEISCTEGVDISIPNLSETYIHKCLHDIHLLGLIDNPQGQQ